MISFRKIQVIIIKKTNKNQHNPTNSLFSFRIILTQNQREIQKREKHKKIKIKAKIYSNHRFNLRNYKMWFNLKICFNKIKKLNLQIKTIIPTLKTLINLIFLTTKNLKKKKQNFLEMHRNLRYLEIRILRQLIIHPKIQRLPKIQNYLAILLFNPAAIFLQINNQYPRLLKRSKKTIKNKAISLVKILKDFSAIQHHSLNLTYLAILKIKLKIINPYLEYHSIKLNQILLICSEIMATLQNSKHNSTTILYSLQIIKIKIKLQPSILPTCSQPQRIIHS